MPEEARVHDAESRCHALVKDVFGTDDNVRYERLRAVEEVEVLELKSRVGQLARGDLVDRNRVRRLGDFIDAVANAERELLHARRAADRIKMDSAGPRKHAKCAADADAAITRLSDSKAFDALRTIQLGDLTDDARAVAILCVMDRMQIARGLPKQLKVDLLMHPYEAFFGVSAPKLPATANEPLKAALWLEYLAQVASAAGHPVPEETKSVANRELLAWSGVLEGLADRLRSSADNLSPATELQHVARVLVRRIDAEYRALEDAVLKAPEPAGPPSFVGPPEAQR